MIVGFIIIFICLLGSAFFSASETAYNLANEGQLEKDAEKGFIKKLAYKISQSYNFALTTILIGNNIVNFTLSAVATSICLVLLVDSGLTGENVAAGIATAVTTLVVLIFGEIAPKVIAKGNSKALINLFAFPLYLLMIVFFPVAWLLNKLILLVGKIFSDDDSGVTTDELASMIETGEEEGSIDEDRSELLQSAIDFGDTSIKEIMIPRVDMVAVDIADGIDEIIKVAFETPYSRIPVYEESIDNIIGILVVQKLYKKLIDTPKEEIDLHELLVEPYFIHMTVKLDDALDVLREERTHIMIVLDEFGGTLGIATMEDILEELVGEIWDEDEEIEHDIVRAGPDKYSVEGDMNIFDFFEAIDFEAGDFESEYTTVGGWAIEMLEGFPEEGASFKHENLTITIETIEDHRITKLTAAVEQPEEE